MINSRLGLVSAAINAYHAKVSTYQAPLIPKLRGYFAEFLNHDSLDRLGILYLSTCVGLGYGRLMTRSRSFSRQHRITHTTTRMWQWHQISDITRRGFTYTSSYILTLGQPSPRMGYLPASLRSLPNTRLGRRVTNTPTPRRVTKVRLPCSASRASAGTSFRRYGNINPLSIDYACRPRLRSRLTQGRLA